MRIQILIFILLTSCSSQNNEGNLNSQAEETITLQKAEEKKLNSVVLVLYDYSNSLDSDAIHRMSTTAFEIVKHAPPLTRVIFAPMENKLYQHSTFDFTKEIEPGSPKKKQKWKKLNYKKAKYAGDLIYNSFHKKKLNKSCILTGLKSAYLNIQDIKNIPISLVVISDMLECCKPKLCAEDKSGFVKLTKDIPNNGLEKYPLGEIISSDKLFLSINPTDNHKHNELQNSPSFDEYWDQIWIHLKINPKKKIILTNTNVSDIF